MVVVVAVALLEISLDLVMVRLKETHITETAHMWSIKCMRETKIFLEEIYMPQNSCNFS